MARRKGTAKDAMAARKDALPTKRQDIYTAEYAGYLVCDLTTAHEKELDAFKPTAGEILTWQQELVDSGFKLIGVYSKDGASVRAELHDMDVTSDTAGWRLSSFADNFLDAVVVLYYKYSVILGGDLSLASQTREKRRWG